MEHPTENAHLGILSELSEVLEVLQIRRAHGGEVNVGEWS